MRRLLGLAVLIVLVLPACGGAQSPAAMPDGTTSVTVTQDPSLMTGPPASAPPAASAAPRPATSATPAEPAPTSFEGAVHAEIEPIAHKCYTRRVNQDSRVGDGTVTVRVVVKPQGPVQATDLGSTLNDAKTIDCILGAFGQLTFRPTDGHELDSTVPFTFIKSAE